MTNARYKGPKVHLEGYHASLETINAVMQPKNMRAMLQYLQKGKADQASNAEFGPASSPLRHCTALQAILLLATQGVKTDLKLEQLLN